jgi:hypothetical protein
MGSCSAEPAPFINSLRSIRVAAHNKPHHASQLPNAQPMLAVVRQQCQFFQPLPEATFAHRRENRHILTRWHDHSDRQRNSQLAHLFVAPVAQPLIAAA